MLLKRMFGWGALIVGVLAGLAPVAQAGDAKIIAGSHCRQFPADAIPQQWLLGYLKTDPLYAFNAASVPIDVICPISRDNSSSLLSPMYRVKVRGRVLGTADKIRCTLFALSGLDGKIGAGTGVSREAGPENGVVSLDWFSPGLGASSELTTFALTCTVPPGGGIVSILYEEN